MKRQSKEQSVPEIIRNNVSQLSQEEAKAILAGIVAIRQEADTYDYEADKGAGRYVFNSAAEKFGYDTWRYLIEHKAIVLMKQQEFLPIQ